MYRSVPASVPDEHEVRLVHLLGVLPFLQYIATYSTEHKCDGYLNVMEPV